MIPNTSSTIRRVFEGLPNYILGFVIVSTIVFTLAAIGAENPSIRISIWGYRLTNALTGAGFGLLCALLYAPLQNLLNGKRIRWLSFVLAIGIFVVAKYLLNYLTRIR